MKKIRIFETNLNFKMKKKPLILVVNDDGYEAKGLKNLVEVASKFGEVLVVAPDGPRSGMSHAITMHIPLRIKKISEENGIRVYTTNGTPVDCVKLAQKVILKGEYPDLVLSGINHGSNSAISILYSGTMAAALEAAFENIPSIGFSVQSYDADANFDLANQIAETVIQQVINDGLPERTCLNVNIPDIPKEDCLGIRVTRQAKGYWKEDLVPYMDPYGKEYYWLTGSFLNLDDGEDTDEWALSHKYASVHPVHFDLTAHHHLDYFKKWETNII